MGEFAVVPLALLPSTMGAPSATLTHLFLLLPGDVVAHRAEVVGLPLSVRGGLLALHAVASDPLLSELLRPSYPSGHLPPPGRE